MELAFSKMELQLHFLGVGFAVSRLRFAVWRKTWRGAASARSKSNARILKRCVASSKHVFASGSRERPLMSPPSAVFSFVPNDSTRVR